MAVAQRIYAEALFGAAKGAGKLAEVHEALGDFAAAVAESPELRAVLRNPQLEPNTKATRCDCGTSSVNNSRGARVGGPKSRGVIAVAQA